MSVGSTRKIESVGSSASKANRIARSPGYRSQSVEDIDTTNNVLVRDDSETPDRQKEGFFSSSNKKAPDFKATTANISTSLDALVLSGALQEDEEEQKRTDSKVNIYNNNQSIIRDEEVERTGRTYLKHFYEKNEHLTDVDKLV